MSLGGKSPLAGTPPRLDVGGPLRTRGGGNTESHGVGVGRGVDLGGARHSQHPAVQLPAHDQPEGLLGELHAVEGGRRAAAHARGLPGHLVALAGRVFDLEEERGGVTRSPLGRRPPPLTSLLFPSPSRGGSSPSTATRRVSLGAAQPPWAWVSSRESGGPLLRAAMRPARSLHAPACPARPP